MTVIAYRDGKLAGDTCVSEDGMNVATMQKVVRTPSGAVAGACGTLQAVSRFLSWAKKDFSKRSRPKADPEDKEFVGMVIRPDGTAWFYENSWEPFTVDGPYYAIGSGATAALVAMDVGLDAEGAAKCACKRVHGCAEPIQIVSL